MTESSASNAARDPILRVVPAPADINSNGHIFGGWVLSQMDIAGGIVAARIAQGPTATVAIEAMEFIAPILLRDIISVYAHLERRGRTSTGIRIEVIATRGRGQEEVKVTGGLFTFVALDENHRPRALPPVWRRNAIRARQTDSRNCGCRWPEPESPRSAGHRDAGACAVACRASDRDRRKSPAQNRPRTDWRWSR